jgi:hypothetical protein
MADLCRLWQARTGDEVDPYVQRVLATYRFRHGFDTRGCDHRRRDQRVYLALALQERGLTAHVYEQAPLLAEIGAAVALSANATRELVRIGLGDGLDAASITPTELIHRRWRDGTKVAAHLVGAGSWYRDRFHAPFYGIHQGRPQAVLAGAPGPGTVHLGCRLGELGERPDWMDRAVLLPVASSAAPGRPTPCCTCRTARRPTNATRHWPASIGTSPGSTNTTSTPLCTARQRVPLCYRWTCCPGSSLAGGRCGRSGGSGVLPRMRSAAFSAIIMVAAWVALFGQ